MADKIKIKSLQLENILRELGLAPDSCNYVITIESNDRDTKLRFSNVTLEKEEDTTLEQKNAATDNKETPHDNNTANAVSIIKNPLARSNALNKLEEEFRSFLGIHNPDNTGYYCFSERRNFEQLAYLTIGHCIYDNFNSLMTEIKDLLNMINSYIHLGYTNEYLKDLFWQPDSYTDYYLDSLQRALEDCYDVFNILVSERCVNKMDAGYKNALEIVCNKLTNGCCYQVEVRFLPEEWYSEGTWTLEYKIRGGL